jgi:hypothetical protein
MLRQGVHGLHFFESERPRLGEVQPQGTGQGAARLEREFRDAGNTF